MQSKWYSDIYTYFASLGLLPQRIYWVITALQIITDTHWCIIDGQYIASRNIQLLG